jgi:signal transduction histidine kinase
VKRLRRRSARPPEHGRSPEPEASAVDQELRVEAERGRKLVAESPEIVLVLDDEGRLVAASRRAREALGNLVEGVRVGDDVLTEEHGRVPIRVPYEIDGRPETLVYLSAPGDLAAYEELRAGFTAAVSHELRTPLARLLALLETALLPGADQERLIEQARGEIGEIGELIDDVLFLSELETGRESVRLGSTLALPVLRDVAASLADKAARAGVRVIVAGEESAELPLRPRMIRAIAENLADNAVRYAGPGAELTLSVAREADGVVLTAADDGVGVAEQELHRLFERFYRSDRARASRGTGLGLAIVKHVVGAAGGRVEAAGGRGHGLTVRCIFPAP